MSQAATPRTLGHSVFLTSLGWFGLCWSETGLRSSTIGHRTAAAAKRSLGPSLASGCELAPAGLQEQMIAFAEGADCDFRDVQLDLPRMTDFKTRVLLCCQGIRYGETLSYGQLAQLAGSPRAARAVGSVMAGNPLPVIIPCHRVVGANHTLGGFSAPTGVSLKKRLLRLEANHELHG